MDDMTPCAWLGCSKPSTAGGFFCREHEGDVTSGFQRFMRGDGDGWAEAHLASARAWMAAQQTGARAWHVDMGGPTSRPEWQGKVLLLLREGADLTTIVLSPEEAEQIGAQLARAGRRIGGG